MGASAIHHSSVGFLTEWKGYINFFKKFQHFIMGIRPSEPFVWSFKSCIIFSPLTVVIYNFPKTALPICTWFTGTIQASTPFIFVLWLPFCHQGWLLIKEKLENSINRFSSKPYPQHVLKNWLKAPLYRCPDIVRSC